MDILNIRSMMKTRSIYDIPMRVTFYARVSSEKDEQLNSLDNQISYYKNYINQNPAWTYVEGYIDEGISGISTAKRDNFNRMIKDAKLGQFDLIVTKEITRFARNTVDSIQFTRDLLNYGVGVFFERDNINTLDEDSELRLTIMSGIAQDELRKLSSRVKFGHQEAIKKSFVLGNSRMFGYRKENKKLVIDEEEAVMVRELFELYASDQYSMKQLEDLFWEKGYRNLNGKKICHSTMSNTISNPKYKGYYVGNKVRIVDMFTKKQKFLPPEEWVMFKDETGEIVPAIVDEELWDKANVVLARRSKDVKRRQNRCNHSNLLTGKLFCTDCGRAYYRKDSKDKEGNVNSKWVCSGKINNGADSCASFPLYETELKPILFEAFKSTSDSAEKMVEEYIEILKQLEMGENIQKAFERVNKKIDSLNKKKSKLLELLMEDNISNRSFGDMTRQIDAELLDCEKELAELSEKQESRDEYKKHIDTIRRVLRNAEKDAAEGIINEDFIKKYIDKIFVTPMDGDTVNLQIKVFTGDVFESMLRRLKARSYAVCGGHDGDNILIGRTGHTMKKMIESYENSMK